MSKDNKQDETSPIALKRRKIDGSDENSFVSQPILTINTSSGSTSMSGGPPPPPLPSSVPLALKSNVPPMKKVNWTVITPVKLPEDCFWSEKNDEPPFEDLFAGLAENFSTKPAKKIEASLGARSNINLRVIDMKSAQNLLILLRVQYKNIPYEQIRKYISDCDCSMLSVDFIEGLQKSLPEPYKIKQLTELKEENVELVNVEKFIADTCGIVRLLPRLDLIKFKIRFNDMIFGLRPDIEAGVAACEEVIASKKLQKILKLILSVGNMMNYGSCNQKAVGFELSVLPTLNAIKANDNKRTLLDYLVQMIEKNHHELLTFGDELINVDIAAHLNVDNIEERVGEMAALSEKLKVELENDEVIRLSRDKFVEVMKPFSLQCQHEVAISTEMTNQMQNAYKKVGGFYAFDVKEYPMKKCFSDIKVFKNMFNQAISETAKHQLAYEQHDEEKVTLVDYDAPGMQRMIKKHIREFKIKLTPLTKEEIMAADQSLQLFYNLRDSAMQKVAKK